MNNSRGLRAEDPMNSAANGREWPSSSLLRASRRDDQKLTGSSGRVWPSGRVQYGKGLCAEPWSAKRLKIPSVVTVLF